MFSAQKTIHNRLIVALDVPSAEEAYRFADLLKEHVRFFKVGLQLYTAAGPSIIQRLKKQDLKVFLDLKFHDIPNTVSNAAIEAIKQGVDMLTLHASGGLDMMKQCRERTQDFAKKEGLPLPQILGVTILTSTEQTTPEKTKNPPTTLLDKTLILAQEAQAAGLQGIITSPLELEGLRRKFPSPFLMVVPGIRPQGYDTNDQKRVSTPAEAIKKGADFLVVGRPILQSPDPAQTTLKILEELKREAR